MEEILRPGSFFPQKKKFMQYWIFPFVGFVGLTWNKNLSFPHFIPNLLNPSQNSIFSTNELSAKNLKLISSEKSKQNHLSYSFLCSESEKDRFIFKTNLYDYFLMSKNQLEINIANLDSLNKKKNSEKSFIKQSKDFEKMVGVIDSFPPQRMDKLVSSTPTNSTVQMKQLEKQFIFSNEIFETTPILEKILFYKSKYKKPQWFKLNFYSDFSKNFKNPRDNVFLNKFAFPLKKQKFVFYEKSAKKMLPIPLLNENTSLFKQSPNHMISILEKKELSHFNQKFVELNDSFDFSMNPVTRKKEDGFSIQKNPSKLIFEKSPLISYEKAKNLFDYTAKILELKKPLLQNQSIKSIDFLEKLKIQEDFIKKKQFSSKLLLKFQHFKNQKNLMLNSFLYSSKSAELNSENLILKKMRLKTETKKVSKHDFNKIFLQSLTKKLKVDLDKFMLLKNFWTKTNKLKSINAINTNFLSKNFILKQLDSNLVSDLNLKELKLFEKFNKDKNFQFAQNSNLAIYFLEMKQFVDELYFLNYWKKTVSFSKETRNFSDFYKKKEKFLNNEIDFLNQNEKNYSDFFNFQKQSLLLNETFLNKLIKIQNLLAEILYEKENNLFETIGLEKQNLEFYKKENFYLPKRFLPIELTNPILLSSFSFEDFTKSSNIKIYQQHLLNPFSLILSDLKSSYFDLLKWRKNILNKENTNFIQNQSMQTPYLIGSFLSSKENNSNVSYQPFQNKGNFFNIFQNIKGICFINSNNFFNQFLFFVKNLSLNITKKIKTCQPFFLEPTSFNLKTKSFLLKKKYKLGNKIQKMKLIKRKKELNKQNWATSIEKKEKNKKEKIFRTLFSYKSSLNYETNLSLNSTLEKFKFDSLIIQQLKKRIQLNLKKKQNVNRYRLNSKNFHFSNSFKTKKTNNKFHKSEKLISFYKKKETFFFKGTNKKQISLNHYFRRIGFLFLSEWNLKKNSCSYPMVENSVLQRFEKEKSFQKKRRRKKLKLETRRRKKRKRFYPRPVWLRYSLYRKFLTTRHPSFAKHSLLKSTNKKQVNYFRKKIGSKKNMNFVNTSLWKSSNKVLGKRLTNNFFNLKIISFKNEKLKQKIYRNNKQNWGNFIQDTPKYEKILLTKVLTARHLPVFQNKEYYKVSPQILSEFQPLCWRSYWLRSNLTPYMNRVQKYFEKMKEIEKSEKVISSFRSFLSSLLGFHIIDGLFVIDPELTSYITHKNMLNSAFNPLIDLKTKNVKQKVMEEKNGSSFSTNLAFYSNLKNSFNHQGLAATNTALFGETFYIAEYNRIQFERLSDILKKVKFNMNLEGKNKAKSYKFNAWKFLASKKELKMQNKKQFWYRLSKEIHPNLSSMSPFVVLSNLKGDTSLKPYGSSATLRVLWSFNKTNQFTFKERNQIKELWEKTKLREQLKSNQTRKFFSKIFSSFSLNYYKDPLLLKKSIIKENNLKKNQIGLMSQMKNKQALIKKINLSTIDKFQIIQKKRNVLNLFQQKTQPIFLLNPISQNNKIVRFKKAKKQTFLFKTYHPKFYDFYLRQLKFDLKFNSKRNITKKMKFNSNKKREDSIQRARLLKSSSVFWWSSQNFKMPLNLNSFNSIDFSKKENNIFFNDFNFETEKIFSSNWIFTFSILFHLSILFSFIRIPELRGLLKFQGLILYKITNNLFIILYSIYELLKKYKQQWIKSFSIFLRLSSLILDPNPIDKEIGFSKNQSAVTATSKFYHKLSVSKTNPSFIKENFVVLNKERFFKIPSLYNKFLFKKRERKTISFLNSMEFYDFEMTSINNLLSPSLLLIKKKPFIGFLLNPFDFKKSKISKLALEKQRFKSTSNLNVISISDEYLNTKVFQKSEILKFNILEFNLNFPKILNKNWLLYSFLYKNSLKANEKISIIRKSFNKTPSIYLFEKNFISSIFLQKQLSLLKNKSYLSFKTLNSFKKILSKNFSNFFLSVINIQTKFALFFLFLTKSTVIFSSNCIQLSYQLILKIIDFFESILLIVYKFLEKPAELMIEWIAQIFLIEWSSDLSTFIPETFDMYFWDSFQKFFRNSRFFGFIEFQKAIFLSSNFDSISKGISEGKTITSLSLIPNNSFVSSLLSFQIINTIGFFIQRRLWSFYHLFLDSMLKPDMDLMVRQKKGRIFWDIWAEILIKAAEQYQINLPSLTSLKEEQEKFIERLIQDPSFFKKFGTFNEAYVKKPFLKDFHSMKLMEIYLNKKHFCNKLQKENALNKEQNLFSNFYFNLWNHSYKTKSWASNQYVTFNLKDTDLFLDLSPPKSLFSVNFINGYEPIQYTLGSIMCEIYSGLFSSKISKNLLIVSSNLPSSNLNSSLSRTSYGNLMIQALAGESEMKMMIDNANRYATIQRGVAVGMKLLKDVFDSIVLQTPCFFLIEEIHIIGERRPMLISDDENSKAFQSVFGVEQGEESEKNQLIYQLNRHSINDFRRPYKGDFSRLIPTNLYMKDLYSFKKFKGNPKLNFQKKYPISMPIIENQLKTEQSMEFYSIGSNTSRINSCLQIQSKQFFVPPATSPFTILMMKEQTKLKPKQIVKPMRWNSFLVDQINSNKMDSIRVKVSILADMTLRNFSVKLDMITDLLVIIDSVRSNRGFVVFATTHLPSILDPALRRPGRFDETISLPLLPNLMNRWSLFQMNLNEVGFQKKFSKDTFDRFDYGLFTENYHFTQISDLISKSKLSILNARFFTSYHTKNLSSSLINVSNSFSFKQMFLSNKKKTSLNENFLLKKYPMKHPNQALQSSFVDKDFLENFTFLKSNKSTSLAENSSQISFGYFQMGSVLIQMDLLKDQKTYSFYNKSLILDQFSPLLFNVLYSSNSEFKRILFKFLGGKMSEFLATKNSRSLGTLNSFENQQFINISEKKNDFTKNPFSQINQPIRYQSWRFSTSWIFSILQKRFLTKNNLIVTKMLSFDNPNQSSLREPPSPPASSLLMPAKKYENFKRVERDFQQKLGFSIHEKMQMHQKQRFLKKLYNKPVVESFKSQLFENRFTSFSSCFKEFSFFDSLLLKSSSSNSYYKNRLSMRHRFSLINQWWNGQLAEHNVETTYLSEIDWRSIYIKTVSSSFDQTKVRNMKNLDLNLLLNKSLKENYNSPRQLLISSNELTKKTQSIDSILDFPDADQHYNSRTRRWFLHTNSWNYWLNIGNIFYYDIYYHYIVEAFNKTSDYFEKNRELLDFMVSKFLQKGFLKEIDLIFLLARFYQK